MSGLRASLLIARLAWKRMLRGRAVWFTLAAMALPVLVALGNDRTPDSWKGVFDTVILLLAVFPPLHLATAVSEEIDDNTFTYLWSRPIPRWSLLTGKLLAIGPALVALFCGSLAVSFYITFGPVAGDNLDVLARSLGAGAVGVASIGLLAIGFGSVVPKYPLATVVAFMLLFDLVIGQIPFAINQLSVTHHIRAIAGMPADAEQAAAMIGIYEAGGVGNAVGWALGIGLLWLGIALWRVRVAEYATSK